MTFMISLAIGYAVTFTHPLLQEPQMISAAQLREMIIDVLDTAPRPALKGEVPTELLMLTSAVESKLGTYYKQIGGPALGIMQMEPATAQDIYDNFLRFPRNLDLLFWVDELKGSQSVSHALKYNLAYQIAMARVHYWRVRDPLPENDVEGLAKYWKAHFNTHLGKGTVFKAIRDYELYAFNNL